ncbi:hypothetical protein SLS64_011761 [Diaporthe eres]
MVYEGGNQVAAAAQDGDAPLADGAVKPGVEDPRQDVADERREKDYRDNRVADLVELLKLYGSSKQ